MKESDGVFFILIRKLLGATGSTIIFKYYLSFDIWSTMVMEIRKISKSILEYSSIYFQALNMFLFTSWIYWSMCLYNYNLAWDMECLSHTRKHKFNSWTVECLTITQLFSFFLSFFSLSHAVWMMFKINMGKNQEKKRVLWKPLCWFFSFKKGGLNSKDKI